MGKLKNISVVFGLIVLTSFFISCNTDIDINAYIDKNAPLKMTIYKKNSSTGFATSDNFEIAVNSNKYKKLIEWSNKNNEDWQPAPASYSANLFIGQGDFRLLTIGKGHNVVIGFTDKKGQSNQYIKSIKKHELDFLIK